MKSTLIISILVLCLGVTECAFATDSYLCIGSKITFFIYDNHYKICRSITEESYNIYMVEKHKNTKFMWSVRKPGERAISYLCKEGFNENEYLSCDFMGNFRMYKKNLVFLNSYNEGLCYSPDVNEPLTTEAGINIPFIEIGRCHPF